MLGLNERNNIVNMKKLILLTLALVMAVSAFAGCAQSEATETQVSGEETVSQVEEAAAPEEAPEAADEESEMQPPSDGQQMQPSLDEDGNEIGMAEDVYTFDNAPVEIIREGISSLTLPNGETHYYEVIYLPEGGVNWVQAKNLAIEAGGYLVSLHSDEENEFVFSLIEDEKYWFRWEENDVCNGPFIGAFQPEGSEEPDGGWKWVSGEDWTYESWAVDGMDGDEDPRPNDQPNDATGNQCVGAYGEITIPVSTWGDFPRKMSSYNDETLRGLWIYY